MPNRQGDSPMKNTMLSSSLYVALALFFGFHDELLELTNDKLPTMTWLDWTKMAASAIGSALVTLKAYLNTDMAQAKPPHDAQPTS
jgi:hypothetical protein